MYALGDANEREESARSTVTMKRNRAEFSEETKRTIAGRAGYQCSFPGCELITVGPGASHDDISISGVAAHIYSAANGGPRGTGGLSEEERQEASNGIWLCENHAKLVDNNGGKSYPPSLLLSWKQLQEARTARAQRNLYKPFGWFYEIELGENPVFTSSQKVRLGKVTVIYGFNGTGKTALCERLAGLSDVEQLERWIRFEPRQEIKKTTYLVRFFDQLDHAVRVTIGSHGIKYTVDDISVPANPLPFKSITITTGSLPGRRGEFSQFRGDISYLSAVFRIPDPVLTNFIPLVATSAGIFVDDVKLATDVDRSSRIFVTMKGRPPNTRFDRLSSGEQGRVVIELALTMAQFYSRYYPTLLILELGELHLDDEAVEQYCRALQSKKFEFQTVITLVPHRTGSTFWTGAELVEITGERPVAEIYQDDF